jgi:IS5 family transposase
MSNLINFALREEFSKIKTLSRSSRLEEIEKIIDWNKFLQLFPEKEASRGRPPYEKILMVKLLFLQGCYGISDEELEFQVNDRISFRNFLDFPESIPDFSTIWRFREDLADKDTIDKIWAELHRQISEKNIQVKEGVIQDASFIIAEPGKKNGNAPRGRTAETSRSKDGTWTKKGKKSYFGFKRHIKVRRGSKIIEEVAVTTAKTFDGAIDLAQPNEIVYRDKGYTGVNTKAKGNGTMKRGKLDIYQRLRNKRIMKKRAEGEHPIAAIERCLKGGKTRLTTIYRVFVQQVFVCIAYNLHRLRFLLTQDSDSFL